MSTMRPTRSDFLAGRVEERVPFPACPNRCGRRSGCRTDRPSSLKASIDSGSRVGRLADRLAAGLDIDALDRRAIERRRQIVDDGVEQRLNALVLERRPAQYREESRR